MKSIADEALNGLAVGADKIEEGIKDVIYDSPDINVMLLVERSAYRMLLDVFNGNVSRVASNVGLQRHTVKRKLTKLGLDPWAYRK